MSVLTKRTTVQLQGLRVVITGAGGGIGTAAREALSRSGARVTGIDLLASDGVLEADICDRVALTAAMEQAVSDLGGIDVLINNAGIGRAQDSGDFPDADARAVVDVNFFGSWNATAAALPHLLESPGGHVVNVSSGLAFVDIPFAAAYSASKRALAAYSSALRVEYRDRLTVTTVFPGYIRTSIHDAPSVAGVSLEGLVRADTVEGAAAAIVRACVKRPRNITTSRASSMELWAAKRFPRSTEAVIARRTQRWAAQRNAPGFLRFPSSASWAGSAERTDAN